MFIKIGYIVVFSISFLHLVNAIIPGSNCCYKHMVKKNLTLAAYNALSGVLPPPQVVLMIDRVEYNMKYDPRPCDQTFPVAVPASHNGRYAPRASLMMHRQLIYSDEYILSLDGQNADSVQRLEGFDPFFYIFVEFLRKDSSRTAISALPDSNSDYVEPSVKLDVSDPNCPMCAIIMRYILTIKGQKGAEIDNYFQFRVMSEPRSWVQDDMGGYRESELSGYLQECPESYRVSTPPTVKLVVESFCENCRIDMYFKHVTDGSFARASYEQVSKDVSPDGKSFLHGQVEITNLVVERYSDAIARVITNDDYLPLLDVQHQPDRHCDVGNMVIDVNDLSDWFFGRYSMGDGGFPCSLDRIK
ncbi:hypothetical protein RF11_15453 [Thelohanellus kitauei]|uniref:Uncharacterized protein n=1 Tax=Thelohanellus kitauei TaxID=669202 RepID=A0A0C2MW62_THEKT|nr:hypothetical protein RF11_07956 [Thelohanellus kitauei]KII73380.1 hypothetical protein RF11_15453 [Thelohanellus kitauei]